MKKYFVAIFLGLVAPASANDVVEVFLKYGAGAAETGGEAPLKLIELARNDIGKNAKQLGLPRSLWCGYYVEQLRKKAGLKHTGNGWAADQLRRGTRVSRPVPGAIAVTRRRGGAHTGIVTKVLPNGNFMLASGNSGERTRDGRHVTEHEYSISSAVGFVIPN